MIHLLYQSVLSINSCNTAFVTNIVSCKQVAIRRMWQDYYIYLKPLPTLHSVIFMNHDSVSISKTTIFGFWYDLRYLRNIRWCNIYERTSEVTDESEVGTKASVTDHICERLVLLLFRIYRTITACKMKD